VITLAPDPHVPQRDEMLDAAAMGPRLARLLGPLTVEDCTRVVARYRVGQRVSVAYRVRIDGAVHVVTARSYPTAGKAAAAAARSTVGAVPVSPLRPVAWDGELRAVYWAFPNDNRVAAVNVLRPRRSGVVAARLVRYLPERNAVAAWSDAGGATVAYAKAYAEVGTHVPAAHAWLTARLDGDLRVSRLLSFSPAARLLVTEALGGDRLDQLHGAERERALRALGRGLARLHDVPPPGWLPCRPWLPMSVRAVTDAIAAVRPDLADAAGALYHALCASRPSYAGPLVCLHNDPSPRNVFMAEGGVALIDLDSIALGPAAIDLARVLAALLGQRVVGALTPPEHDRLRAALLAGYAELRDPPPDRAVRWHTAATLCEVRGRKAVAWLDPVSAEHLDALLTAARELL